MNDLEGFNIDEAAELFANVTVRSHTAVLRQLYRSAQKDRLVDDLVVAAALKVFPKQEGSRHLLTSLVAEVLSARASQLADREFSGELKLPEMVSVAASG